MLTPSGVSKDASDVCASALIASIDNQRIVARLFICFSLLLAHVSTASRFLHSEEFCKKT